MRDFPDRAPDFPDPDVKPASRKPMYPTDPAAIDWDFIERDTIEKIRYLRMCWQASASGAMRGASPALNEKLVQDIYGPCLALLARFAASVKVEDSKEEE